MRHTVTPSHCPNCNSTLDACTGINHRHAPRPGDFTICCKCAAILVFGSDMELIQPTAHELSLLPPQHLKELQKAVITIKHVNNQHA